ncbi:hypothetical protein FOXB_01183 [Fusarium oxysporum f. sp. conglutinans Fo5176]|uniref:Uncharacterized protein n=1 Tax=Fusarium oxysporum (strain Fo5176) TaxID=660025 RepID=F9F458_FUSOF|nr:hypothetical protein FOXB_01183 [Fusarium oxysporum f. sp. conglutinans Fo5176]
MSDFRTRIPCREITSLSKLYNVLTTEYGNMYYKLETENNEHGELFYVVGISCHFARDVKELLVTKGVLRESARPRGFTAINGPRPRGDPLPEVIDLTWDDSDEEPPPAHGSTNTVNIPRDLTPGSRRLLAGAEETSDYIAKSKTIAELNKDQSQQATARLAKETLGQGGSRYLCYSRVLILELDLRLEIGQVTQACAANLTFGNGRNWRFGDSVFGVCLQGWSL